MPSGQAPDPYAPETRPFTTPPGSPAQRMMYCRDLVIMADGPTGSGKTRPALEKAYYCASHWPKTRVLLLRKAKAHASTTIQTTWTTQVVPEGDPSAILTSRNYRSPAYLFPNGSEVSVDGMYDGGGYNQAVMGTEWDLIIADEATHFSEDDAQRLIGRLNRIAPTPDRIPFNQIILPCNPDAPQHWLWRWHLAGRLTRIASRLEDNPVFHDGQGWTPQGRKYLATVDRYTGVMRDRNRFGKWVGAEGMIYEGWREDLHLVDRIPVGSSHWWRIRSIDFGYTNPSVCGWWAIDPSNCAMYLERELVRVRTDSVAFAEEIARYTPEPALIWRTVADHEDANARSVLSRSGIQTVGCDKPKSLTDWPVHLGAVMRRLAGDQDGPRLFVLRDALVDRDPRAGDIPLGFAEEVTGYVWDPPKEGRAPKEKPQDLNNHAMDQARYAVRFVDQHFQPGMAPPMPVVQSPYPQVDGRAKEPPKTWVGGRFTQGRGVGYHNQR